MRGIAEQGDAAIRHVAWRSQRGAIEQGPRAPRRHGFEQRLQCHARVARGSLQGVETAGLIPVAHVACGCRLCDDDHVERSTSAHRIRHRMQPRPEPDIHAIDVTQRNRQRRHLDQSAPGRVTRSARPHVVAHDLLAHHAPQTVGADKRIAFPCARVVGRQANDVVAGCDFSDACTAVESVACIARAHGVHQHRVQIGPVHAKVRRPVALLHRLAERQSRDGAVTGCAAHHERRRPCSDGGKRHTEPERLQSSRGVRPQLHAGTDLMKGIGLFEHFDAMTSARQRQRAGQSADAAARDEDACGHRPQCVVSGFASALPQAPQVSQAPQPEFLASDAASWSARA